MSWCLAIDFKEVVEEELYEDIQDKLEKYLEDALHPHYTYIDRTHVAIQFQYKHLEIDLLLSPYWETKEEYYTAMRQIKVPKERFKWFSASVSRYQINFINKHQGRVKELIRRAKAWSKVAWKDDKSGKPKSYLMALLVITAWHRVGVVVQNKRKCKQVVEPMEIEMKKLICEIATTEDLDLRIPGTSPDVLRSDLLYPFTPRIIDPANPVNNLYKSGVCPNEDKSEGRWEPFKRKIQDFKLSYPAFTSYLSSI